MGVSAQLTEPRAAGLPHVTADPLVLFAHVVAPLLDGFSQSESCPHIYLKCYLICEASL